MPPYGRWHGRARAGLTHAEAGCTGCHYDCADDTWFPDDDDDDDGSAKVNLFFLADGRYSPARHASPDGFMHVCYSSSAWRFVDAEDERCRKRKHDDARNRCSWRDQWHRMRADLGVGPRRDALFPPDARWLLRNLTAKEIVRADALARPDWRRDGMQPFVKGDINFGDVVFARTSWSLREGKESYDALT